MRESRAASGADVAAGDCEAAEVERDDDDGEAVVDMDEAAEVCDVVAMGGGPVIGKGADTRLLGLGLRRRL